jgi:hypothetical protein
MSELLQEAQRRERHGKRRNIAVNGGKPEYETAEWSRERVPNERYRASVTERDLERVHAEAQHRASRANLSGTLSESEVWGACRAAVRATARLASVTEQDALTSELVERVYRKWQVIGKRGERVIPAGCVTRGWLAYRVRNLYRDSQRWRDTLEGLESLERRESRERDEREALAVPLAEDLREIAESVTDALQVAATELGVTWSPRVRECVRVALLAELPDGSGEPPRGPVLAKQLGKSYGTTRNQIADGRLAIVQAVQGRGSRLAAVIRAEAERLGLTEPAPVAVPIDPRRRPWCPLSGAPHGSMFSALRPVNPELVDCRRDPALSGTLRALRTLLDTLADVTPAPHATHALDREPRTTDGKPRALACTWSLELAVRHAVRRTGELAPLL